MDKKKKSTLTLKMMNWMLLLWIISRVLFIWKPYRYLISSYQSIYLKLNKENELRIGRKIIKVTYHLKVPKKRYLILSSLRLIIHVKDLSILQPVIEKQITWILSLDINLFVNTLFVNILFVNILFVNILFVNILFVNILFVNIFRIIQNLLVK